MIENKEDKSNLVFIIKKDKDKTKDIPYLLQKDYTRSNSLQTKDHFYREWIKNTMVIKKNYKSVTFSLITNEKLKIYNAYKTGIFSYAIENTNKEKIANVKSNILSNKFAVQVENKLILNVQYDLNFLGYAGPIKLDVNLNSDDITMNNHSFTNKQPIYSKIFNCYTLRFIERKVISSIKNFQLVQKGSSNEDIYYQFAKGGEDFYYIDYKEPFSSLAAFAIGVIALSHKMMCE